MLLVETNIFTQETFSSYYTQTLHTDCSRQKSKEHSEPFQAGSIIDIGGMGAISKKQFFEKRPLYLSASPKRMSFSTNSNENFYKN